MKLNLIYYKNLLDASIEKMFASIGNMFRRLDNGSYVFCGGWNKTKLSREFEHCLRKTMLEVVLPNTKTFDKYVVISSCYPIDNLLFTWKSQSYFPKKLEKFILCRPNLKYILKECDICIDLEMLNDIFIDTFNKLFNHNYIIKLLGENFSNVIFVSHSFLDCYAMFKVIKWAYGSSSCVNLWKEKMTNQMQHLIALNELIAKYI